MEVYQFARDSDAAEAWLLAQDSYISNRDLGESLDAVENLIKKHEAFEKAAAAQEERFLGLERLTTVSSGYKLEISVLYLLFMELYSINACCKL